MDWKAALLRRLARRFHIGDDVLRHLSTFQRLGERLEAAPPGEMLPVGARTALRALRTRSAAQIRPDWLWPYWLERQLDPTSPSFVPRGHLPFSTNVTHRNWTAVGNPGSAWEAIVDPAGLVTPALDSWSVDWWVRSSDRWHLPSRETEIVQELVGTHPIVRTTIPVPGGEVAQTVFATEVVAGEHVVMQVTNASEEPVEAAFAIRPYNPEGLAVAETITIGERRVMVDGEIAMLLPASPHVDALSTYHEGDSLHHLFAGGGDGGRPKTVNDPAGFAQAAVLYPISPGESIRVAIPLPPREHQVPVATIDRLPDGDDVSRRWTAVLDRGMSVSLPDADVQAAVDANRAYMLLFHDPGDITPGPATYHRFWFRDAAYQLAALDRWGFHEEAEDVIRTYPGRQRHDGFFYSQWREWDANGAAIYTIAEHHRLTGDRDLLEELLPAVRAGTNWIERARHGRIRGAGRSGDQPELRGLLPAGISAEHLGPYDYYYWDDFWALRGLRDAAEIARWVGEHDAANRIDRAGDAFRDDILASIGLVIGRIGETLIPAGPFRTADAGMIGSLVACVPLELFAHDEPLVQGTLEALRDRHTIGSAFFQEIAHTGFGTYLTLQLAFVELERGDPRAWRRLQWMVEAATPTWTWPEAIHPQLGGGCMGDGHHGWAAADVLNFVRAVLLREVGGKSVALLGVLPPTWYGADVEVRNAPTHHGLLSYRLSWDGERPVLEWEWATGGSTLRAPGVDASWSSDEPGGEATFDPIA